MEQGNPVVSDHIEEALAQLLVEAIDTRERVLQKGNRRLNRFRNDFENGEFSDNARNLAHYLAQRHLDCSALRCCLDRVGLASPGVSDTELLAHLDATIELVRRAIAAPKITATRRPEQGKTTRTGTVHSDALFGPTANARSVRLMVTLPGEAGKDDRLIRSLLTRGMDCARIECADHDRATWMAMIDRVHRASVALGRPCTILMELAGHRLCTGPLQTQPAPRPISVRRDAHGNRIGPATLLLTDHRSRIPEIPDADTHCVQLDSSWHSQLQSGDQLLLVDNRGKQCCFDVLEKSVSGAWRACSFHGAELAEMTSVQWRRPGENRDQVLGEFTLRLAAGAPVVVCLAVGDPLLLTYTRQPGRAAIVNAAGLVVEPARIGCSIPAALRSLRPGDPVWFGNGTIGAEVDQITEQGILLSVTHARAGGTTLQSGEKLHCPSTPFNLPALTARDLDDLDFVCRHADIVGVSWVETLDDMDQLIQALAQRGAQRMPIVATMETDRAIKNLPDIILGTIGRHPLGVMIARGDLMADAGRARLAQIENDLLALCDAARIPVIWSSRVFRALFGNGIPTHSERAGTPSVVRANCVMLEVQSSIEPAVQSLNNRLTKRQIRRPFGQRPIAS